MDTPTNEPMAGANPASQESHENKKIMTITALVIVLLAGGIGITWYIKKNYYPKPTGSTMQEARQAGQTPVPTTESSLGSEIYEKASNPIGDKLPETVAPTPNPLEETYKNPFQ